VLHLSRLNKDRRQRNSQSASTTFSDTTRMAPVFPVRSVIHLRMRFQAPFRTERWRS